MKTENIGLSNSEKIGFIMSLSTMLSAGITLMEVIESLLEDAKGNQKKILQVLKDDVNQGKRIYSSFAKFPQVFDKVTINIIKASEEAGTLDTTLKQIKDNIQKDMEFMDKVKSALIYPLFIVLVFIGVLVMILFVVMPKISTVFSRMKVTLPLPTQILIFLSNLLVTQTIPIIIGLTIFLVLLYLLFKSQKKFFINFIFSLPLINILVVKIDLTRFSRSLYMLLNSGIIITTALDLTQEVVASQDVRKAIVNSKEAVLAGKKFTDGLKSRKKTIPSIMLKIIEAGERSGSLDKSLEEVAQYFDYEVSNNLKTLTALIEPIMLVIVGVMVGGMMMAIIAPIYSLIGQVGTH